MMALRLLWTAHRDPLTALNALTKSGQELIQVARLPGSRKALYVAYGERHIRQTMVDDAASYAKGLSYQVFTQLFGYGLINSEGQRWREQHRRVQPAFSARAVRSHVPAIAAIAREHVRRLERRTDGPVDVHTAMNGMALDIVGRTLFEHDLNDDAAVVSDALLTLFDTLMKRVYSPLTWLSPPLQRRLPTRTQRRYSRAHAEIAAVAEAVIAAHSVTRRGRPDVVDHLLAGRGSTSSPADVRAAVSELVVFLIAAHETSANVLSWALWLLSRHPEIRAAVEDEVDKADPEATDLRWVDAVLRETMRLYPPAWYIERRALRDLELDGTSIAAGSIIALPPYMVHRNPRLWPRPERFEPQRFLGQASNHFGLAYVPFGAGERRCLGSGFATTEMSIALAEMLRTWRAETAPDEVVVPEPIVTLRPRGGLPMRLIRR